MFIIKILRLDLRKIVVYLASLVAFLFFSTLAEAATIQISPSSGSYNVGQTYTTVVRVNPSGKVINAVEATLKFDPSVVSVVSVGKDGSFFSFWTTEPTFSNSAGTINFGGGSQNAVSSSANLVTVTWRALAAGSASVSINSAMVTAADGMGTDVYENSSPASYSITASTATPPPAPTETTTPPASSVSSNSSSEAIVFGDPPRSPEIGSTIFSDSDIWYRVKDGVFSWTLPFDVTAVAMEITDDPDNQPEKHKEAIFEPPVEEFKISADNVIDGVQYLSIKFKNQVGWGAVNNRKIQIDTLPPEPFEIEVRNGVNSSSFPTVVFEAKDTTSGINYYELSIAGKEAIKVTPDEAKLGFLLKELEDGTYTVKVVAYDKAGNSVESTKAVLITAGWIKPVTEVVEKTLMDFVTPINSLIFFLIIIICLLLIYIWYEKKQINSREEKLRKETREIQDQMEKIFSALRDEIYDQVNLISKRKRLTKGEKEAVEGLNQALEVSETLIEKEINDVKAILK